MRKDWTKKPFAFLPSLLVWIGLVVVLPATALGEHGRSLEKWLYNFQTLIGGALALAAAYVTIRKMGDIDRDQALRHVQLIAVQLRTDKLLLERTYGLQCQDVKRISENILQHVNKTFEDIKLAKISNVTDQMRSATFEARKAKAALEEIRNNDVIRLFGPDLARLYQLLLDLSEVLSRPLYIKTGMPSYNSQLVPIAEAFEEGFEEEAMEALSNYLENARLFNIRAEKFDDDLRFLEMSYPAAIDSK